MPQAASPSRSSAAGPATTSSSAPGDMPLTEQDFLAIYRRTVDPLYRTVARHTLGNRALAEDVVQETYLRALDAWSTRSLPGTPLAWLRTVAMNLLRSHHRRRQPQPVSAECLDGWLAAAQTSEAAAPEEPHHPGSSVESLVAWGLARMAPEKARLLESVYFDQRTLKQVAAEHGKSAKAIERQLARARASLRSILTPHISADADRTPAPPHTSTNNRAGCQEP